MKGHIHVKANVEFWEKNIKKMERNLFNIVLYFSACIN